MEEEILQKLIGQKFGRLTIIKAYVNPDGKSQIIVDCKCKCGNILTGYPLYQLTNGNMKSCGCSRKSKEINPKMGGPKKDIFNVKFNKLTPISEDENGTVTAKCDCGNVVEIPNFRKKMSYLKKTGMCDNCKKTEREKKKPKKYTDFKKGDKFGYFTIIKRVEDNKNGSAQYECQCQCGTKKIVQGRYLANGQTKSCGCMVKQNFKKSHTLNGVTQTRAGFKLYGIWNYYKKHINTNKEKGEIKFFPEWVSQKDGFLKFYNWATLQKNPYDGITKKYLKRVDETKDYTPENCYFSRIR